MLAFGTVLQDRYKITGTLGKGGMGAVYEATDLRFGSAVALKQTLVDGDELLKAFGREARLLNKLRHAALPVVFDYFAEGEGQFLVMQYIPGDDLAALLARQGTAFAPEIVVRWGEQLLDALEYLHTQEPPVIHRDIKPQNLKLTPRGEIILLDFGLSKTSAAGQTRATTSVSVLGYTPQYAPFEQINGAGTDPRSDLYSLAATLYHLFTNVPPVDAMTRAQCAMSGQPDPLRRADEVNSSVPAATASALQSALAMNREERPDSAAALRALLRAGANAHSAPTPVASTLVSGLPAEAGRSTHHMAATVTSGSGSATVHTASESIGGARPLVMRWWKQFAVAGVLVAIIALVGLPRLTRRSEPDGATASALGAAPTAAAPVKESGADARLRKITPPEATFKFDTVSLNALGRVTERRSQLGRYFTEDLGEGVSIDLVAIPAGKFVMGTHETADGEYADESPQHEVSVKRFYMGRYEVTQAEWRAVAALPKVQRELPAEPSKFKGDELPVDSVSWEEAMEFCARLTKKAGRVYRLPSEAEWEYAARAGSTDDFAFGPTIITEFVNFDGSAPFASAPVGPKRGAPVPVGSLRVANAFGLYDIYGNVLEWCAGEYHDNYQGAPTDGSAWLTNGDVKHHVVRGGGWDSFAVDCRSANRFSYAQEGRRSDIGFRVAMSVE